MRARYQSLTRSDKGVALLIVLAFIVLLAGLVATYFSRTGSDRQLAESSFDNTNADILARSALEIIVGDFRQEVADDPILPAPDNIMPQRSGNPPDVPNMIRRSVRLDGITAPALASRASAVNSTDDAAANGRSIAAARWNKHYLIPRRAPLAGETTNTIYTDPVSSFVSPDWVLVSDVGPIVIEAPNPSIIGRYAYAVYDEGGLLDLNVAGFPSANSTDSTYLGTIGKKGSLAFADLTATGLSFGAIDNIIGWRNYLSADPTGSYSSFGFPPNPLQFVQYFLETEVPIGQDKDRNFGVVATPAAYNAANPRTDQALITRGELLELRRSLEFSQDAMQYFGTFSREPNRSTWGHSGIDLAARFLLSRFDLFTDPVANATAIQQYFGLRYVAASGPTAEHWQYCGTSGNTLLSSIPSITGVGQNPDLFPLLQYALPVGTSSSEILSIGASLIDQRDANEDTTWIEFGGPALPQKAFGVDNNPSTEPGAPPLPSVVTILNRGFRNVGELGYAYRNGSTTLDFRTASSADAPLLDLFTYNTATSRSGVINLNTRNIPVLTAVIKGAFPTDSSDSGISQADATVAATSIVSETTAQPALGRHDIARLAGSVIAPPFSIDEEKNETIARALAEVTQTRTWNLMVDVIAQSGKFTPNATDLAQFVVRGEKRYWLHIAVDRFTGEVIDKQLEAVYE